MNSQNDELLNETQVAKLIGMARGTVCRWRHERRGPMYMKLGRSVRYHRSVVEAWMLEQSVPTDAHR